MRYGITKHDIKYIDEKISKQKKWILDNLSDFDFADNKSALDFTYSAAINPKQYFAEMNNRINSIFDFAKELNLKPVFATITAPSKYHKMNNKKELLISPNETAKQLTQIFNKFTNLQVFQKMKKSLGHGLIYFRVYEPHKSGVPHMHLMMFLPSDSILEVKNKFYEYFTNKVRWGNNSKSLDFKYTWYKSAGGAVAYIMKYITKTFKDSKSDKLQHEAYWYIKYNVRRFLCSRTLAPITVYRKVRYFFKEQNSTYLDVSKLYEDNQLKRCFSDTTFTYMKYDFENDTVDEIVLWEKNVESILHKRIKQNSTFKLAYEKADYKEALTVYVNEFEKYSFSDSLNKFMLLPVVPSKLTDYQLQKFYRDLKEFDNENKTFLITKNEMIKRGFINTEISTLSNDVYTEKEEYINNDDFEIDLETGEFISYNLTQIDVVRTIDQVGF